MVTLECECGFTCGTPAGLERHRARTSGEPVRPPPPPPRCAPEPLHRPAGPGWFWGLTLEGPCPAGPRGGPRGGRRAGRSSWAAGLGRE